MTTADSHPSSASPPPPAHDGDDAWRSPVQGPVRTAAPGVGRRVTAVVAAGALAVGLLGGVGFGRLTAPAAASTGVGASSSLQGGPGGLGGPGAAGLPGQMGAPGGSTGSSDSSGTTSSTSGTSST